MPNRTLDNGRVPRQKGLDKRIKLTPQEKAEIRTNADGLSHRQLAEMYGVSKSLVGLIVSPERRAKHKQWLESVGGWKAYYHTNRHREYMQNHRKHKQQLLAEGKLLTNKQACTDTQ